MDHLPSVCRDCSPALPPTSSLFGGGPPAPPPLPHPGRQHSSAQFLVSDLGEKSKNPHLLLSSPTSLRYLLSPAFLPSTATVGSTRVAVLWSCLSSVRRATAQQQQQQQQQQLSIPCSSNSVYCRHRSLARRRHSDLNDAKAVATCSVVPG